MVVSALSRKRVKPESKILAVRNYILQRVMKHEYRVGVRIPPEKDLIHMLGYSRSTIREAVSSLVHDGMLQRRRGSGTYVVSHQPARPFNRLALLDVIRVGLVVSSRYVSRPSPYLLSIVRGLSGPVSGMPRADVRFVVADPDYKGVGRLHFDDLVRDGQVDALVFSISQIDPDDLARVEQRRVPFVFLGGDSEDPAHGYARVRTDLAGGVSKAVTHLHEAGRRRLGLILGRRGGYTASEFLAGTVAAQVRLGQVPDVTRVLYAEEDLSLVAGHARALRADRVDAILCCDDETAMACMKALVADGVSIPGDVAVVGANDTIDCAADGLPSLATLAMPYEPIGRAVMDLICSSLVTGRISSQHQVFMPKLIVRESVPCASSLGAP